MTDKELLELAAKAAGMVVTKHPRDGLGRVWADGRAWNPLDDDGDALRLAVRLKLSVCHEFDRVDVLYENDPLATEFMYEKPEPTDRHAATRRVIVRAAAEIGKAM